MSTLIAVVFAVLIIARLAYVVWYNGTLREASRFMKRGNHQTDMAELAFDRIEAYERYGNARRAYRRAARLYLRVGRYNDAKFAVYQSIQAGKLFDKYLYM
jgi:uncharacterized protein YxeA